MSKNIEQIFIDNPITSNVSTDLMYFGQSPYGAGNDAAMTFANFSAQFILNMLTTKGDLLSFSTTTTRLPVGSTNGQVLQVNSSAATGLSYSAATYPTTTAINQILYSSVADTVTGITTNNDGVLITSVAGVPSISSTLPTAVQANITQLGSQSQALNMNSHQINNVSTPTATNDAATKGYVDTIAQGLNPVESAKAATIANLNATYNNGTAGVGATLTNAGTQVAFAVDGYSASLNDRILVKNQTTTANNGIYTVTTVGDGTTNWVLTRATDYNTPTDIAPGDFIAIVNGTTQASSTWIETATVVTIGTDPITFSVFFNPSTYAGSTSIVTVGTITTGTWHGSLIDLSHGGSNANLTANNGGIVWSNATQLQILAGTATAGLALLSGASTTPNWSTSPPITQVNVQTFSASGTYTKTAGTQYAIAEVQGGGGGGGGFLGTGANTGAASSGGSGGYARVLLTSAQLGASQTVTINTGGGGAASGNNPGTDGGSVTFGALITCNGGGHGLGSTTSASGQFIAGGAGGTVTVSTGTVLQATQGEAGSGGHGFGGITGQFSGKGGSCLFGKGGAEVWLSAGNNGTGFGSGGSGGAGTSASAAGGNGQNGYIVITEYISV